MSAIQKWVLTVATLAVVFSGALYGLFKYFGGALSRRFPALFPQTNDPFTAIQHPLQPWALDLHVVAAPLLVFAIGWIFKDHVLAKLSVEGVPVRRSGILALVLVLPMIASGYLIQTVAQETPHLTVVIAHVAAGSVFAAAYGLHVALAPNRNGKNGAGGSHSGPRARPDRET